MAINTGKVVTGGLAAGVVLAILDFLVNGLLLAGANRAAMTALNPTLAEGMESSGVMIAYIVLDLVFGLLLVWTYAAMRPRFGPGPKTAVFAGLQVWCVAFLLYLSMTIMGMWAWGYFATVSVAMVVIMLIGALVGGMLYKEA
jgi:hypothetical protein